MFYMEIIIDFRESTLLQELIQLSSMHNSTHPDKQISVISKNLDIGDIIIQYENSPIVCIERKSLSDLECSIKDGRYSEQASRLNASSFHNHNIIYLIEGNITTFKPRSISISTFHSTIFSILFYKGFSVIKTLNLSESALFIFNAAMKIIRDKKSLGFFSSVNDSDISDISSLSNNNPPSYTSSVKTCKKDNLSPIHIHTVMLSNIPQISIKTASILIEHFKSLPLIIHNINHEPHLIKNFTYLNDKGQNKKLTKPVINNLFNYFSTS